MEGYAGKTSNIISYSKGSVVMGAKIKLLITEDNPKFCKALSDYFNTKDEIDVVRCSS